MSESLLSQSYPHRGTEVFLSTSPMTDHRPRSASFSAANLPRPAHHHHHERHTWLDPVRRRTSHAVEPLLGRGTSHKHPPTYGATESSAESEGEEQLEEEEEEDDHKPFLEGLREVFLSDSRGFVLALILFNQMTSNGLISIVAPFFPVEAEKRYHANATIVGFVMAAYPLAVMLSAPIWAHYTPNMGRLPVYIVGTIILIIGTALFPFSPTSTMCMIIRAIQGIGQSAGATTSMAIAADMFPGSVGFVTGLSEVSIGIGFFLGPPIGSIFHSIGGDAYGYYIPFLVMAATLAVQLVLFVAFAWKDRHELNKTEERHTSAAVSMRDLYSPSIVLTFFGLIVASVCYTFFDPFLEIELNSRLHVTDIQKGILFGLPALPYSLASPIAGRLSDKLGCKPMIISGLLMHCCAFFFLGPTPFVERAFPVLGTVGGQWVLKIAALFLFGTASAFAVIPTYPDMHHGVAHLGPEAVDKIAGLWTMAFSMGEVVGPVLGGLGFDALGFGWECFIVSMTTLTYAIIIATLLALGLVAVTGTGDGDDEDKEEEEDA